MKYTAKKNSAVKYRQVVLYKGSQTLVGSKSIIAALSAAPWINQNQTLTVLISVKHIDSSLNSCHVPFQECTLTSINPDQTT